MLSLLPLIATAALVSLSQPALGHIIDSTKLELDNNLLPAPPQPRRQLKQIQTQIVSAPKPVLSVAAGELVLLECEVFGSPAPKIVWLRDGQKVTNADDDTDIIPPIRQIVTIRSRLVIVASRRLESFTCVASNGHPHVSASTVLFVDGDKEADPLAALESAPVITTSYTELLQETGTDVTLPCRARAHGDAQIIWTHNDDGPVHESERYTVLPSGDLVIRSLNWNDKGRFSCTVIDRFGEDVAETFVYPMKPSRH